MEKRFQTKRPITREDLLCRGIARFPNVARDWSGRKAAQPYGKSTGAAAGRLQAAGVHQLGFVLGKGRGRRWQQLLEFLVFERFAARRQPYAVVGGLWLGLFREWVSAATCWSSGCHKHEQRWHGDERGSGLELLSWTRFHCLSGGSSLSLLIENYVIKDPVCGFNWFDAFFRKLGCWMKESVINFVVARWLNLHGRFFFFLRSLESILLRVLKYYLLKYSKLCVYFNLKKLSYKFLRHFFDFVCQMNWI